MDDEKRSGKWWQNSYNILTEKRKKNEKKRDRNEQITLMMKLVRRPFAVSTWSSEKVPADSVDPDRVTATSAAQQRWERSPMAISATVRAPPVAISTLDTCERFFGFVQMVGGAGGWWCEQKKRNAANGLSER